MKLEHVMNDPYYDGKGLWVCIFRQSDMSKKAERNVKPTHVVFRKLDTPLRVGWRYLTHSAFKIAKNGSETKTIVPLRGMYNGVELEFFENESEATQRYVEMLEDHIKHFQDEADKVKAKLRSEIEKF